MGKNLIRTLVIALPLTSVLMFSNFSRNQELKITIPSPIKLIENEYNKGLKKTSQTLKPLFDDYFSENFPEGRIPRYSANLTSKIFNSSEVSKEHDWQSYATALREYIKTKRN